MKFLSLISVLAAATSFSALANSSKPIPDINCGCVGDACGGVSVYIMGKIKNPAHSQESFRIKVVVEGLGEGEEATIARYIGVVPSYQLSDILRGESTSLPASVLALQSPSSFVFGGMISDTVASIVFNGENSLLIEPGKAKGTTTITQISCSL